MAGREKGKLKNWETEKIKQGRKVWSESERGIEKVAGGEKLVADEGSPA